jgi:hypothetical protein
MHAAQEGKIIRSLYQRQSFLLAHASTSLQPHTANSAHFTPRAVGPQDKWWIGGLVDS